MKKIIYSVLTLNLLFISCQGNRSPWQDRVLQATVDKIALELVAKNGFASSLHITVVDSLGHQIAESWKVNGEMGVTYNERDVRIGSLLMPFWVALSNTPIDSIELPVGYKPFDSTPVVDRNILMDDKGCPLTSAPLPAALRNGSRVAAVELCKRYCQSHVSKMPAYELRSHLGKWIPEQYLPWAWNKMTFIKLCAGEFSLPPTVLLEAYQKLMLSHPDIGRLMQQSSEGYKLAWLTELDIKGSGVTALAVGHATDGRLFLMIAENCCTTVEQLIQEFETNL